MNVADSIVTAINIPQIIKNLLHLLQRWKLFSVFFALDHSPDS